MSTTHLKRIALKGFRSIREMDLELAPINLLIGANGAGKSNFLSFFRFIHALLRKELALYVAKNDGAGKILHFGSKRTPTMECRIDLADGRYVARLAASASNRLYFEEERWSAPGSLWALADEAFMVAATPGDTESALPRYYSQDAGSEIADRMRNWRVYHFHDTTPEAKVKSTGRIDQTDSLRSDASNLAAFLRSIRSTSAYVRIVRTIQRIAPYLVDFVLEPEDEAGKQIRLRWRHSGSDDVFDISDFSDGTLRFICLTTLLLQPNPPNVIVLDEPELGLHPAALTILAAMMQSVSAQTQIIASTQSVTLANQFGMEDVIVVEREDEASVFRRLDAAAFRDWLDEYSVGDLWEKNVIGGNP